MIPPDPPPTPPPPPPAGAGSPPGPAAPPPAPGAPRVNPLRELLFADLAPAEARATFARGGAATAYLLALADAAERHDAGAARNILGSLVPPADRETRMHLQSWTLARLAGVDPGEDAKNVLGVVVDVHLDEGLDTLAAFLDGSARYLNHGGGGVVWETPDMAVGQLVRQLIGEAAVVVAMGAPLEGERIGPPPPGGTSIWVLTRGGIYVGTGPSPAISADPRGGPVMQAATELLQLLVSRSQQR